MLNIQNSIGDTNISEPKTRELIITNKRGGGEKGERNNPFLILESSIDNFKHKQTYICNDEILYTHRLFL